MPLTPRQRRWLLVVVVYDVTRVMHLDAFRDGIVAAFIAKLFDSKIKKKP